jgi:hypothetical protein
MNAQNIIQGYVAAEAIPAFRAAVVDTSGDRKAKLPTGANQRALGVVDEHGVADEAGNVAGVIRKGWAKAEVAGAVAAGDRLNIAGTTGKLKTAIASLSADMTAPNADFTITSKVQGAEGDRWSLELVDPGGASATLAVVIYDHHIRVTLGRATSAINTLASDLKTLLEANTEFAAKLTFTHTGSSTGAGLLNAMSKTYFSGGGDDFADALEAANADGRVIPIFID